MLLHFGESIFSWVAQSSQWVENRHLGPFILLIIGLALFAYIQRGNKIGDTVHPKGFDSTKQATT